MWATGLEPGSPARAGKAESRRQDRGGKAVEAARMKQQRAPAAFACSALAHLCSKSGSMRSLMAVRCAARAGLICQDSGYLHGARRPKFVTPAPRASAQDPPALLQTTGGQQPLQGGHWGRGRGTAHPQQAAPAGTHPPAQPHPPRVVVRRHPCQQLDQPRVHRHAAPHLHRPAAHNSQKQLQHGPREWGVEGTGVGVSARRPAARSP